MNYTFIKQGVKTERSEMDLILSESPGNGGSYRIQNTVFESRIIHSHHWWKQHRKGFKTESSVYNIYCWPSRADNCRPMPSKHCKTFWRHQMMYRGRCYLCFMSLILIFDLKACQGERVRWLLVWDCASGMEDCSSSVVEGNRNLGWKTGVSTYSPVVPEACQVLHARRGPSCYLYFMSL